MYVHIRYDMYKYMRYSSIVISPSPCVLELCPSSEGLPLLFLQLRGNSVYLLIPLLMDIYVGSGFIMVANKNI